MYFYEIGEHNFLAEGHFIHKALEPVSFPTNKAEISAKVGDVKVKNGFDSTKTINEYLDMMVVDEFSCACQFYCALYAMMF
jgi:hypothetical protein